MSRFHTQRRMAVFKVRRERQSLTPLLQFPATPQGQISRLKRDAAE